MSTTRASNARLVRQRKLNTKQGLRIIRESEIEEQADDEGQRHIQQVETGVEKGEEIEYHLQAVINASNAAALGAKPAGAQSYIPTPEASRAKGVKYDELYPKVFKEPATYIRFSSTVEDCIPVAYCMNDNDAAFLSKLNDGKDADGRDRKGADKLSQCSEDTFEEVMNFFEETSARMQPFANVDNAPILSLEEMEQSVQEDDDRVSAEAHKWLKPVYKYWVLRKGSRPLMPSIKVRVLDTASDADDADPYVCFRRREVRQTRKTRGRDAQVVEKLKKLRLELEQSRQLVQLVVQREHLNKENLETSRKVFEQRKQLKEVKISKGIVGDKGDDEELLVNQKPMIKIKSRQDTAQGQRPATIRIRSGGDRSAPDNDLPLLDDFRAEAEQFVANTIEARKEQHKKWNQHWVDETKYPITPPLEESDPMLKWANFPPTGLYPTPPPSLPSRSSQEGDTGDVDMKDAPPPPEAEADAQPGASFDEPDHIFHMPGTYPPSGAEAYDAPKRDAHPACRLRYGRGGRYYLESRKRKPRGQISSGVVSDSDSDDDYGPEYFPVSEHIIFDYRATLNSRPTRPEGVAGSEPRQRPLSSGEQSAMAGAGGHGHPAMQQVAAGGAG
ncbi:hypothetical protein LTR36_005916 [Oleoguttula mirabilis]|uniref:Enhancer of polycomb-like protein n=1 Tax=Oleoguttula mirabilis TaxID=1507867 RepID=A0AAV9JD98_9PEZI|nr:hypothetical protein LTR36_005916 [Oleoguttula mirabilis]